MAKSESNQSANLGEGNVGRLLLRLAIPSVVAQLINMLYNIVDRIYIGHMPEDGSLALTGVGLCFAVIILISAFASLVGAGARPVPPSTRASRITRRRRTSWATASPP